MKCWYLFEADCDRKGICEGCPTYWIWHKECEELRKEMDGDVNH